MNNSEARNFAKSVMFLQSTRLIQCRCWNTCTNHDRYKNNRMDESLSCTRKYIHMLDNGQCAYFTPVEEDNNG